MTGGTSLTATAVDAHGVGAHAGRARPTVAPAMLIGVATVVRMHPLQAASVSGGGDVMKRRYERRR